MMKLIQKMILIGAAVLLVSSVADAAELRNPQLLQTQPELKVDARAVPQPLEIKKIYKHNCEAEGYQCAGGYTCELLMTKSGEDARGNPVNMGGTKQDFYTCKLSGRTDRPTCSKGMTPTGRFIDGLGRDLRGVPGGVREYFCTVIL